MSGLVILIPVALLLGLGGLAAFFWSVRSGQFEDLDGAALRILIDDDPPPRAEPDEQARPSDLVLALVVALLAPIPMPGGTGQSTPAFTLCTGGETTPLRRGEHRQDYGAPACHAAAFGARSTRRPEDDDYA